LGGGGEGEILLCLPTVMEEIEHMFVQRGLDRVHGLTALEALGTGSVLEIFVIEEHHGFPTNTNTNNSNVQPVSCSQRKVSSSTTTTTLSSLTSGC